jgi:hypothetical protein
MVVGILLDLVLVFLQTTFGLHVTVGNFNVVSTGIAVTIGFVIGLCAGRAAWWLAAVCLLPMVLVSLLMEPSGADLTLYLVNIAVALIVAFLVSSLRRQTALA